MAENQYRQVGKEVAKLQGYQKINGKWYSPEQIAYFNAIDQQQQAPQQQAPQQQAPQSLYRGGAGGGLLGGGLHRGGGQQ